MEKRLFNQPRAGNSGPRLWEELLEQRRLIRDDFIRERLLLRDLRERTERLLSGARAQPVRWEAPPPQAPPRPSPASPAGKVPLPPVTPSAPAEKPAEPRLRAQLVRLAGAVRAARPQVLAGAAAALLLLSAALIRRPWASPLRAVFPLPFPGAAGLCADAKTGLLYTTDPARQLLFSVSPDRGQLKSVQRFPAPALKGLACIPDGNFWSSDGAALYRHQAANRNSIGRKYSLPGLRPGALYWDGRTLWAADPARGAVDRLLPGDGFSSIGSFPVDGKLLAGIASGQDLLWAADALDLKLYRYPVSGSPQERDSLALEPLLPKGSRPTGFALTDGEIWIMTDNPSELRCFTLKNLRFRKGER